MSLCEQKCGASATVYAIDPYPGGWGGRYCRPCAKALRFNVVDVLEVPPGPDLRDPEVKLTISAVATHVKRELGVEDLRAETVELHRIVDELEDALVTRAEAQKRARYGKLATLTQLEEERAWGLAGRLAERVDGWDD